MGRSGNTIKKGLHVALGLVDEDYRSTIGVMAFNQSSDAISFAKGDRVAQMVILPYPKVEFVEVDELSNSDRGDGGYGSTGR
jgi:dUTP pyrophosphatase